MCNCLFLCDSTLIPAHKHASNNRQLQRGQGGHTCGLLDFFRKNVRKIPQKVSCALFQEEADIVFRGEIFDLKLGGGHFSMARSHDTEALCINCATLSSPHCYKLKTMIRGAGRRLTKPWSAPIQT